jgi:formamidopyrimidine-DNA glycosylase
VLTEAGSKRRASIHVVQGADALAPFERAGLEPLDATRDAFAERLRRENHTLKRSLTDPRLFSGSATRTRTRSCTARASRRSSSRAG